MNSPSCTPSPRPVTGGRGRGRGSVRQFTRHPPPHTAQCSARYTIQRRTLTIETLIDCANFLVPLVYLEKYNFSQKIRPIIWNIHPKLNLLVLASSLSREGPPLASPCVFYWWMAGHKNSASPLPSPDPLIRAENINKKINYSHFILIKSLQDTILHGIPRDET